MKRTLFLSAVLILFSFAIKAQQLPLYSQYMMNGFLLNPAIAGSVDYFPVMITARQQWVGINGAPSTQAISGHYLFNNQKLGIGGYLFNDKFGPISRTGIQACFAYHLQLTGIDSKLGIGLAFKAFQFKFDQAKLVAVNENDPAINRGIISQFVPDADFGVYLYNKKYFVGIAATQLIQFNIDLGDSAFDKNQIIRHYYGTGGYKFYLSNDFDLEPSLLLKTTASSPINVDINLKAYYKKNYWLGISYRSDKDIVAMIGLKVSKFYIGYAFDYSMSNIKNYSSGSHEILIGFNIKEGANRGSSLL